MLLTMRGVIFVFHYVPVIESPSVTHVPSFDIECQPQFLLLTNISSEQAKAG